MSIFIEVNIAFVLDNTGNVKYAAYVDPVVCIFFSMYMCITPAKLFLENMQILSVGSVDKETYKYLVDKFKAEIPMFATHSTYFTIFHVAGILWVNIEIFKHKDFDLSLETIYESTQKCQAIINKTHPHNKLSYTYHLDA